MLRPVATRWFEVLCPRREAVRILAELAGTGAVELELRRPEAGEQLLADIASGLDRYQGLARQYQRYWQRGRLRHGPLLEAPGQVMERALARIAAWRHEADPLIDQLQASEEELMGLRWLGQIIEQLRSSSLDFSGLTAAGPILGSFCAILPKHTRLDLPLPMLARSVLWQQEDCWVLLGPRRSLDGAMAQVKAQHGRILVRPDWLKGDAATALTLIHARRAQLSERVVQHYAALDTLFDAYALGDCLGDLLWLEWFSRQVGGLEPASAHLSWITGWTDDLDGQRIGAALDRAGTRALLRFALPPAGARAPQVLRNPGWLRPFELFARALGVPGADEADPTPLLALVVPLLFGYMFGDVGQGLVLMGLGFWLLRRHALARLLVLCGASATVFGVLFGSLFGVEGLIPALWLHPLAHPLSVLLVPLVFAVGLLSVGQLLAGFGALQAGRQRQWLAVEAGLLLLYLSLAGMLAWPGAGLGWLALLGLGWYLLGAYGMAQRLLGALAAVGHLAESALQLLTNTLSFARVGAFALAHAALSAAVVTMAEAAPAWAALLILLLGNLVIILLEGLVVSIQTTRLVLFEFFNRFLQGTGRVFRPLPAPPALVSGGPQ
jgi:V/A-type H+-transporting ATPase subunit I